MGGFCRNVVGPPEWECEAMGSVVWVQCATSVEYINLLIASPQLRTHFKVGHTMGQHLMNLHTKYDVCTLVMAERPLR